jgi:hypothetical protein
MVVGALVSSRWVSRSLSLKNHDQPGLFGSLFWYERVADDFEGGRLDAFLCVVGERAEEFETHRHLRRHRDGA